MKPLLNFLFIFFPKYIDWNYHACKGKEYVVYAATGSTWVEEVIVLFNGSSWTVEMDGGERTDTITSSE